MDLLINNQASNTKMTFDDLKLVILALKIRMPKVQDWTKSAQIQVWIKNAGNWNAK